MIKGRRYLFRTLGASALALGSFVWSSPQLLGSPAHTVSLNIFSVDNRVAMTASKPELAAIGKLQTGRTYCTATQIGQNLLLTAAHCLFDSNSHQQYPLQALQFVPRFGLPNQGQARKVIAAEFGGSNTQSNRAWDWAFLTLEALPSNAEPAQPEMPGAVLSVRMVSPQQMIAMGAVFSVIGYSQDVAQGARPSVHYGCSAKRWHRAVLEHDCDMAPGASGGPMVTGFDAQGRLMGAPIEIVAINVAERYRTSIGFFRLNREPTPVGVAYSSELANLAVHAWNFGESLNRLLAQQPH